MAASLSAWLIATSRKPSDGERKVLTRSLAYHREYFAADAERAKKYVSEGEKPACAAGEEQTLAAWSAVASMVLNLDEVLTKE